MKTILQSKRNAFKVSIYLGYVLVNNTTGEELNYQEGFNTNVFNKAITINSKHDVNEKVLNYLNQADLVDKIFYPGSSWRVKSITEFRMKIFNRSHTLGDDVLVPKEINDSRYINSFKDTQNKCILLHCLLLTTSEERCSFHQIRSKEVFQTIL